MRQKIRTKNKFCFASEFANARHISGFTLKATAKMTGRSVRTIRDWESGKQPCPAWAYRLLVLESRYMDALYGLQFSRAIQCAIGQHRTTIPANDATYSTQLRLKLVSGSDLDQP